MGIIKEPLNIDFEVDSRPLTKDEEKKIFDFIKMRTEEFNQKSQKQKTAIKNPTKKQPV